MSQQHSSLGAIVADHSSTGSRRGGSAIRRCEVDPPEAVIVPYRGPRPLAHSKPIHVGALSPGDAFTTALTGRAGRVLVQTMTDVAEERLGRRKMGDGGSMSHTRIMERGPVERRPVTLVDLAEVIGSEGKVVLQAERKLLAASIMVIPV